ncbi:hypothetical protein JCM10212_005004 [Sporobolomyces blumeae]
MLSVKNLPTIWGFDLSELSFSAFSSKNMFDPKWHLRRERFITYQLAMLICLAAECTATYSLSKYEDLQDNVEGRYPGAHLYNNDIIDMEITTIVFCVFVATLFGADFFFLLQFPRRKYPDWYQNLKKFFAIVIDVGVFAAALGSTIVVANNSAQIVHVSREVAREAASYYYRPPLEYNRWAVNVAYVVVLWIGWVACVVSTVFMFMAAAHDKLNGTDPICDEARSSLERRRRSSSTATATASSSVTPEGPASPLDGSSLPYPPRPMNESDAEKLSKTGSTASQGGLQTPPVDERDDQARPRV